MPAYPRLISPVPAPSSSAAPVPTASPSIPATSEHEHSSPEPYWPRLARALMLLFLAVSLHVWVVRSPEPQEPVYATLASRLVASVLVSPPLPLAPPLRPIMSRRWSAGRRVIIQTSVLNVPPVPGPPVSSPAVDPRLVAVGTSGTTIGWATDTPDVAPRLAPAAPPARATLDDSPSLAASAESRPAPMIAAFTTMPAARASNPVHRSVPGSPRVVRKSCCAPCRSERSGPDRSGGRAGPPEGGRPRRGARIHARARAARRPCHQGGLSIRRRSQASAIVRGCRGTAVPVGLLRRVLFLIGTRRQRVVSWQFDVPAQNWIASPPIHGSGVGVQPSAGWGRMADSRGADSVDGRVGRSAVGSRQVSQSAVCKICDS